MPGTLPLNGADQVAVCIKLHEVVDLSFAVATALVVGEIVNSLPGVVRHISTPVGHDLFRQARAIREIGASGFPVAKSSRRGELASSRVLLSAVFPNMVVLLSSLYLTSASDLFAAQLRSMQRKWGRILCINICSK